MKLAYVFPGQGNQYPGMGRDLAQDFLAAKQTLVQIAEGLARTPAGTYFLPQILSAQLGPAPRQSVVQALVFAHSAMAWAAFASRVGARFRRTTCVGALGHSLGEVTAHFAAGTIGASQAAELVARRGAVMEAGPEGALMNVEELDHWQLDQLRRSFCRGRTSDRHVFVAIRQAPRLHAIGGRRCDVAAFARFLSERSIPCRPIQGVSNPLHTPLQRLCRERFETVLRDVRLGAPHFPVLCTATGDYHVTGEGCTELASQLDGEMRFSQALAVIRKRNPDLYLAFGPCSRIAELLANYNDVDPDRIRVLERTAQVRAMAAELARTTACIPMNTARDAAVRRGQRALLRRTLRKHEGDEEQHILLEPSGEVKPLAGELARSGTLIFLKGSFNPIHNGHIALYEASLRRHPGAWGVFAISVHTAKGRLSRREVLFRSKLVLKAGYPVVVSQSGYFYHNAAWLRSRSPGLRLVFPTGGDVIRRLIDYFSPEDFARHFDKVVFEFAERGQTDLEKRVRSHPAYACVRRLELGPGSLALSSSELRSFARQGRASEVSARMPDAAARLFLQRFRQ